MDFYLITSASSFPCFHINWILYGTNDNFFEIKSKHQLVVKAHMLSLQNLFS